MTSTSHKKEENNKINLEVTHNFVNTKDNYSNPGLVGLQNNSVISSQPLSNNPKENIMDFHGLGLYDLNILDEKTSTSHKKEENNKINLEVTHNFVNTKDNYSNPGLVGLQNNSVISSQPLSNNPKENIMDFHGLGLYDLNILDEKTSTSHKKEENNKINDEITNNFVNTKDNYSNPGLLDLQNNSIISSQPLSNNPKENIMDFHGLSVNDNMTSTSNKKEENNKINLEVTHNFVNTKDNYSNPGLVDLQNNSIISSQPLSNNPKENIIELSNEKHHDKDLPMENKKISIQKEILKLNEFESNMNISKLQGVNIIKEDYNSNNIDFNIKIFIQTSKFEEIDLKNPSPSKIKMETSINTHNSNKEINYVNDNSAVQDNLSNDMNKRDRSNIEQSKQIYNSPLTTINVPVKEIRFSNANREKVDNHSNSDLIISKSREIAGNTSNNKSLFHQEIVNNSIDNHDLSQMLNNLNLSAIMSNNTHLNDNKSNIFGSKRNNEMSSLDNLSNNNQYTPQEGFKDYDNISMNNVQIKEEKNKQEVKQMTLTSMDLEVIQEEDQEVSMH